MLPSRNIDPESRQPEATALMTGPDDHKDAVLLEQVRLLYRQAMPGFAASWFNATVLLGVLYDATAPIWILSWYGLMLLLIAGRVWLVLAFRRHAPGANEIQPWGDRFTFSAFLAGVIWGALALLVHDADFTHKLIVAFVIAGMTAGAVPLLAAIQSAYMSFMLPAMAAMIALLLGNGLQGEPYGFALAAMSIVFALTLILAGRAMERAIAESLRMRFANLTLIASLQQAKQELQQSNDDLRASNQELEAFSYSVSHDLRAPLRAIDGFGLVLLEDYGEKLDVIGKEHLNRIRQAAQRMSILIDAMLNLARLNRSDLQPQTVNLSLLAGKVLELLRQHEPDRAVELHIQPDLQAWGDARLLQLVLDNLLRNAWKFSSRAVWARIEFGCVEQEGERVYFVRDNGVGFDMQYADKLFGAFQRLHGMTEFEGTGIGLATVARIIHRHGGCVWAEGAVGQGAAFYFTLGRGPDA